jgi:hypothetical protein
VEPTSVEKASQTQARLFEKVSFLKGRLMALQRIHFNTNSLVNKCDTAPQKTADQATQTQLFRSIAQLPPTERDLIGRLVENLQLLAQSAPKRPVPLKPKKSSIPLLSIGPSGLNGMFQAEY